MNWSANSIASWNDGRVVTTNVPWPRVCATHDLPGDGKLIDNRANTPQRLRIACVEDSRENSGSHRTCAAESARVVAA